MFDYYEILGIPRDISEEELNKKINAILDSLEAKSEKSLSEMNLNMIAYNLYGSFKKTLENYGSKANYDRALLRSRKIFKVVVLNKDTIKKITAAFVIAGTITGSIIGFNIHKKNNYTDVTIPSYGMSISQICDEYNISISELNFESLLKKIGNKSKETDVFVNVKNDRVDELNEKINNQRKKYYDSLTIEQEKEYSFKYKVKFGDTVYLLSTIYKALDKSFPNGNHINEGDIITIYTTSKEIAETMQKVFDENEKKNEPTSFISYTVKKGDTLPKIANEFNVEPYQILKYNEGLDLQVIYAGETIRIPQYQKAKTR